MLWPRYLGIAFLKCIAFLLLTFTLLVYLLPDGWGGYALSFPLWILAFGVAFAFAQWALSTQLPGKREALLLILCWFTVTITFNVFQSFYTLGTVIPLFYSVDSYVQYLLEALAILLSAYTIRRKRITSVLGEGLVD